MIWASIAEKGGSGKTTVITNLAVYHAMQGKTVMALDFDPMGSLTRWGQTRVEQEEVLEGITVLNASEYEPVNVLENINLDEFDEILLDVPGADDGVLRQALVLADVSLMPLVPGGFDFTNYVEKYFRPSHIPTHDIVWIDVFW